MERMSTDDTYDVLRALARHVPSDQAIVEIGTYQGASAVALGEGSRNGNKAHVYSIDPHDLPGERTTTGKGPLPANPVDYTDPAIRRAAQRNIRDAGLDSIVTLIRGFSTDVAAEWPQEEPVGLLFIDGDHRQSAVRRDYAAWEPHLAETAYIAWDDYNPGFPGVIKAVEQLISKGLITAPIFRGNIAVAQKVKR